MWLSVDHDAALDFWAQLLGDGWRMRHLRNDGVFDDNK
jgi:hypothetical protein